ncbi:oligosaccharide flippase family protein [Shewanella fodinae]|uniref:O-antigen/teichoic acid export membrane protein n=1 Tax=Shewanella fodinae TaxID=552357 RepID=A0A4R2F1G2_9GAMM|nr:oligosaccharide flippase family protein [Shewanella fodinae]TCN77392.1 O-antigen/teichoic acid export membrane protein [Shewanella fodinae]
MENYFKKLGYSFAYNMANAIFPVLTLPLVFRSLSQNSYGDFVLANILYQVINSLFCVSLLQFFIRSYGEVKEQNSEIKAKLCGFFINIQTLSAIASAIIFTILIIIFYNYFKLNIEVACWFYIPIVSSVINVEWLYFSTHRYKPLFMRTIFIKSILFILVLFLIKNNNDLNLYSAIMSVSYAIVNIVGFIYLRNEFIFGRILIPDILRYLKRSKQFYFNSLIGIGYQYVDQIILSILLGKSDLAAVNILKQIGNMLLIIPNTICRFLLPIALESYKKSEGTAYHIKYDKLFVLCVFLIFLIFIIFGYSILKYFVGDLYNFEYQSIMYVAIFFIVVSASVFIDTQYSIPQYLEKITTYSNVIVLTFLLTSVYFFINKFGYLGTLMCITIAEGCGVFFMILLHLLKKYKG